MEPFIPLNESREQNYKFEFFGKGSEYFGIMIVNWLLTVFTLGLYYPWARAKSLRYIWGQTALNDKRFHFAGTGKEMFIGFIKVILFFVGIFVLSSVITAWIHPALGIIFLYLALLAIIHPALGIIFLYLALLAIIPFAIHGGMSYMLSRTTYRGVRFGYRGDRGTLTKKYFRDLLLTILTFGIYGSWMAMNIRRYTHENIRYGDVEFENSSEGTEFFFLNIKGYLLSIITLGIYSFWWQRDIFNYYVDKISMRKGEQKVRCYSTATGGGMFGLLIGNLLIIIFTLGLGVAWAQMRTYRFIWNNVKMEGDINFEEVHQTEEEYKSAFGEDALDFLDLNAI